MKAASSVKLAVWVRGTDDRAGAVAARLAAFAAINGHETLALGFRRRDRLAMKWFGVRIKTLRPSTTMLWRGSWPPMELVIGPTDAVIAFGSMPPTVKAFKVLACADVPTEKVAAKADLVVVSHEALKERIKQKYPVLRIEACTFPSYVDCFPLGNSSRQLGSRRSATVLDAVDAKDVKLSLSDSITTDELEAMPPEEAVSLLRSANAVISHDASPWSIWIREALSAKVRFVGLNDDDLQDSNLVAANPGLLAVVNDAMQGYGT